MSLYTATYRNKHHVTIDGFEVPVLLPDIPPRRAMRNFDKPKSEQKYQRTVFPKWESLTFSEQQTLVAQETHRRNNGEWWLINGNEVYVPGWAHFYFNYWWAEYGKYPEFRMEAVWFFQIWDFCFRDSNCFGIFDVKGRRAGDTEKALCIGYDMATRFKNSWFGQQNIMDTDAQANFERVVKAHAKMQPWFKPVNIGGDAPKNELIFEFPQNKDVKTLLDRSRTTSGDSRGLMSRIDYRPTTLAQYDGKRLRFYYLDEPGKLDPRRMDAMKQWGIIKPCLSLNNQTRIIGKAIFTTTVEDIKSGGAIDICRKFWNGSDPRKKQANGRTETGLYRYFRDFTMGYSWDDFGYPMVLEARQSRVQDLASMAAMGDLTGISDYKRKFPETIDDALATPATDCPLFPGLLDAQMDNLKRIQNSGTPAEKQRLQVRGDLVWSLGFGSDVRWVPNPASGKFCFTRHPDSPNNRIIHGGKIAPGNNGLFTIGIDPIDHIKPKDKFSYGAASVYMPFNPMYETEESYLDENEFNTELMRTDQFICTYKNRPSDPFVFYEDMLMLVIYFGCQAFIERDKPGVLAYFKNHGYSNYLAFKPPVLGVGARETHPGAKTSMALTNVWMPMVMTHVANRVATYRHLDQLQEYRNFTGDNMTQSDLLVASGFALMLATPINAKVNRTPKGWQHRPF